MYLYDWVGDSASACTADPARRELGFSTTSIGTVITDLIPASRRGEGMGWYGMAMTVAMAIGPMLGTYIVGGYSFQTLFLVATGLSLIAFILAYMTRAPYQAKPSAGRIQLVEKSVLPVTVAIFFWLSLTGNYNLPPAVCRVHPGQSGNLFLVYAVALTLIRPFAGKLSDRFGEAAVIIPSLIVTAGALIVLSLSSGLPGLIIAAILYGIGFGSAQPALQRHPAHCSRRSERRNASFMTAFDFGIGLGAILLGLVSERIGYAYLFAVTAVSVVVSLVIFTIFVRRLLTSGVADKE